MTPKGRSFRCDAELQHAERERRRVFDDFMGRAKDTFIMLLEPIERR
jgi:hypothetical protein